MKLSERLKLSRTNRPDEWSMDEYVRQAEELEQQLEIQTVRLVLCTKQLSDANKAISAIYSSCLGGDDGYIELYEIKQWLMTEPYWPAIERALKGE